MIPASPRARAVRLLLVTSLFAVTSGVRVSSAPPVRPPSLRADGPAQRAVVLGIAQDGGVPHIGCTQPLCVRARRDPAARERVAALGLVDDAAGRRWLVEATPDLASQLDSLNAGRSVDRRRPVDGILLTHAHAGHYAGLLALGREMLGADRVPVLGTPRLVAFLRGNAPWRQLEEWGHVRYEEIAPGQEVALGQLRATALPVPHRDELSDTVAWRVRGPGGAVLFLPDVDKWERWDRDLREEVAAVDVAFLDGTFHEDGEVPGRRVEDVPHPFVGETLRLLAAPALRRRVAFLHLNHTNRLLWDGAARAAVERAGARVARDGEVVPLGPAR